MYHLLKNSFCTLPSYIWLLHFRLTMFFISPFLPSLHQPMQENSFILSMPLLVILHIIVPCYYKSHSVLGYKTYNRQQRFFPPAFIITTTWKTIILFTFNNARRSNFHATHFTTYRSLIMEDCVVSLVVIFVISNHFNTIYLWSMSLRSHVIKSYREGNVS